MTKPLKAETEAKKKKSYFWQYLVPAFLSLFIFFGLLFYFHIKPTYQADVFEMDHLLWQISGNENSLKITSINGQTVKQTQYLWVRKSDNAGSTTPYKIGVMPMQNDSSLRYSLPAELGVDVGDELLISDSETINLLENSRPLVITLAAD